MHIKKFGLLIAALLPISVVDAGTRSSFEVAITLDATGVAVEAMGNLADAYNSADTNQFIGCGGNSFSSWCQAHDATANDPNVVNSAFCFTLDPVLIAHIRSVAADSFVFFSLDPATGECQTISVSHNSFYRPKAP